VNARLVRGIAVAIAALAVGVPAAAFAGEDPQPAGDQGEPRFELASMDRSWLAPGGESAAVELALDDAAPAAEVALIAHQVVDSRIRYERTLEGDDLGTIASSVVFPLEQLPQSTSGTRVLGLGVQDPNLPSDATRLQLRRMGVYPVEVQLRDENSNTLAEFVMPLVVVVPNADGSPVVGERLRVAWVWPLVAPPAREPFGQPDPAVVEELLPGGRLGRQAAVLAAAPDVPLTVVPGPETLAAWAEFARADPDSELAESHETMRDALDTNQKLAGPYVQLNVPSLLANGLRDQVGTEIASGTEALSNELGTRVDPRTALVDPVNREAATYLREANVDRMIVDGAALLPAEFEGDPDDPQFTPAQQFILESEGALTEAVATDPGLSAPLTGSGSPALRAQQLLAGLSVVALEQPNLTRGIVIANAADWDAPPELLEAAVSGLRGNQLIQPVDIDQFFAQVPQARDADDALIVRSLEPYSPPRPPVTAGAYLEAQADLNSLASLLGPDDPRVRRGQQALLVSLSSAWEGARGQQRARAELGVIGAASTELLSQIRVPVGNTVTLTARKGEIPVTFLNETDLTLPVKVRLESDKLVFPDGDVREIELPPRSTTIGFTVESRTSGTFPLQLTVTSLDEGLVIQSTQLRVRSTFVSGVGVFITVGAALFLVLWWFLHFRRRRRSRADLPA
jgi:hypothetical protein